MLFSLASWKKSAKSADEARGGSSTSGSSQAEGGKNALRNKTMIVIAALGALGLGYKMFWPDSEPVKAAAQTISPTKMTAPGAKPGTNAARMSARPSAMTPRAKGNDAAASGSASTAAAAMPKTTKSVAAAVAPAQSVAGDDTDVPTPTEIARGLPKDKASAAASAPPAAPAVTTNDILGAAYVDEINGFSMRFPTAWAIRTFNSEPWVLDCGDGRTALISIGFSAFPADFTADNIPPEWVARRIKKRSDTTLHSQGYAMIGGKKALWSKSTGPLPMTNGNPRMTRVNYIIPLHDGRVMELRIATTPEIFDQLMPTMRQSVESFKFIPRAQSAQH
jgi:hypothetical protein